MRTHHPFLLLLAVSALGLVACVSGTSDEAEGSEAALTSLSLNCRYGNAELDIAGGVGTLTVSGQSIGYSCSAPASPTGDVLSCTEQPTTLHTGTWSFAVDENGGTYTAVLTRPGSADVSFACATDGTAVDAGAPGLDASVTMDAGPASDASVSVPSWSEVGPIIHSTCDGCHHNGFSTEAAVKANKSNMIRLISNGRMPKNSPGWNSTSEGKEVLNFLKNSPDLN